MSKRHVVSLYCSVMPEENAENFVDQMFQLFDKDKNGYLDFHVIIKHYLVYSRNVSFDRNSWNLLSLQNQVQSKTD